MKGTRIMAGLVAEMKMKMMKARPSIPSVTTELEAIILKLMCSSTKMKKKEMEALVRMKVQQRSSRRKPL